MESVIVIILNNENDKIIEKFYFNITTLTNVSVQNDIESILFSLETQFRSILLKLLMMDTTLPSLPPDTSWHMLIKTIDIPSTSHGI